MIERRMFLKAAGMGTLVAGGALALALPHGLAQDAPFAGVGSRRSEFEQTFGTGTGIDATFGLWEYPNPDVEESALIVRYNLTPDSDEYVASIEFGFEDAEGGGASREDALDQVLGVMPDTVTDVESFRISSANVAASTYGIVRWTLEEGTGGYVSSILTWFEEVLADGETRVVRASVVNERPGAPAYGPNAETGGIGQTRSEWEATFGEGEATQLGIEYPNVLLPDTESTGVVDFGGPDGTVTNVTFCYEDGTAATDVANIGTTIVPEDTIYGEEYSLPPTPEGPIGVGMVRWESETAATVLENSGSILIVTMLEYTGEGEERLRNQLALRTYVLTPE